MLTTHCTFCQHDNTPGARFCAECGSPMHLKVCANPQCGKVSDATATVCEICGHPFPRINLVAPGTAANASPPVAPPPAAPPVRPSSVQLLDEPAEKPRSLLVPLIVVALFAGSLPLLWMNRAYLPTAKTGAFTTPELAKPAATVVAPIMPITPPQAVTPPAQVVPASAATPAVATATPTAIPAASPTASPSELDPTGPGSGGKTDGTPKASNTKAVPNKKNEAPRECTEALAALGLCKPKQAGK